jgi:hypothetical protein
MRSALILAHGSMVDYFHRRPDNNVNLRRTQLIEEGGLSTTPFLRLPNIDAAVRLPGCGRDADVAKRALASFKEKLRMSGRKQPLGF